MRGLLPSSVLSLHHHRGLTGSTTSSCWHELRRAWFRAAHRWSCALRVWVRAQQRVWQRCYRIPAAAVPPKCEDEKFKTTCDGLSLQRKSKRGKACFSWVTPSVTSPLFFFISVRPGWIPSGFSSCCHPSSERRWLQISHQASQWRRPTALSHWQTIQELQKTPPAPPLPPLLQSLRGFPLQKLPPK